MRRSQYRFAALVSVAAALGLLVLSAGANAEGWSVTSSLADGSTLTHPVQWSATPAGTPPGGLDRIEFLVDGQVRWIEHNPPFFFNDDSNYLYPYLFARGAHQLVVRAVSKTGEQITATANVEMAQAVPRTPRPLRATWKRRVKNSSPEAPSGVYRIKWGAKGVESITPPPGTGVPPGAYAFSASPGGLLRIGGPVNWLLAQSALDYPCHGSESFGRYRWRVAGRVLTLKALKDPCALRKHALTGRWRRA